ncbi:hypothetical protein EOD39_20909 [Acipenser ruthenus]|uniref:Uncharacterized protein n=1 Tax=Acipenser ruthenus TaxID=7906 RepID=A0A444UU57_ACIRT|nr:hypothetical protein EOD39_20909 [Acipenser ruthenus]
MRKERTERTVSPDSESEDEGAEWQVLEPQDALMLSSDAEESTPATLQHAVRPERDPSPTPSCENLHEESEAGAMGDLKDLQEMEGEIGTEDTEDRENAIFARPKRQSHSPKMLRSGERHICKTKTPKMLTYEALGELSVVRKEVRTQESQLHHVH